MDVAGRQRAIWFYAGLGTVTAATLMLQIVETRIISVLSWYHLAFFVISIAMFGLTVGAVYVYLRPDRSTPDRLFFQLTAATLAFAVSTVLAGIAQLTLATGGTASLTALFAWTEFSICLAIPFFFSGVVVSLALTRSPYPIGTVYGVDLVGAAFGCIGVLALLNATSGPAALLWLGALLGVAAFCFARAAPVPAAAGRTLGAALFRYRLPICVALLALAALNELTPYGVRMIVTKNRFEATRLLDYDQWNSFSRITVTQSEAKPAGLWGRSPHTPDMQVDQRTLTIDGAAGTSMYRYGDIEDLPFLRYDVTNIAYAIPGLETGAVIGVGGGRDVISAKLLGLDEVTGVEINPIFVDLLTDRFADYSPLAREPGVELVVDEARSWMARAGRSFDIIQMSLIDTWAATGAGAFTLSENGLYTTEAWRIFLDRLRHDGVFTVSRWYAPGDINETGRMVSLAVATLLSAGAENPRDHIFLASANHVATIVMARAPLTATALGALRGATDRLGFNILLDPDRPGASETLEAIVSARTPAALAAVTGGTMLDLSPSTDSRPFFFNQLRFSRLLDFDVFTQFDNPGVFGGNLTATITLVMLVLISVVFVVLTIVVPLRPTVRRAGWMLAAGGTAYFVLIGTGFMMAEIALLQRMGVFLGHPVYALSVVLFSLILSTGIGSFVSERLLLDTRRRLVLWALASAAYLFCLPLWLPPVLLALESAGLLVRAGLCVLVLAPAGILMGFGFPTGMRLVSAIDPRPTPWFWGVNGAAGVLAAGIAVLLSIAFGIDTTLRVGALCYLLLLLPATALAGHGRAVAGPARPLQAATAT
ncbi:spermidine synthase family protein [Geminicoccus roseus]|uniref:class I SAM-dependent methyltransferase n=1 Tax=Geminicoccus roseus TaxID=404900 RepID=UPI00040937FC|nr:class I SAM-dependent methyltransferase [Geminicoccus roseus]